MMTFLLSVLAVVVLALIICAPVLLVAWADSRRHRCEGCGSPCVDNGSFEWWQCSRSVPSKEVAQVTQSTQVTQFQRPLEISVALVV